jgi:RND family efflux transporter MFP subunit
MGREVSVQRRAFNLTICGILACAAVSAVVYRAVAAEDKSLSRTLSLSLASNEERGFTRPADEVELGFNIPGLVSLVKVKDGDVVKKGQILVEQDTEVERAALAKEQYLLKSNVQLRAAEAQRDLANVKLKRAQKLFDDGAGSVLELEEAKLEVTVSNLKVELAHEETESKRLEIVRLKKQIERMRMICPVDGVIRKVEAAVGEVTDPQKPSLVMVRNDELKVEVKLPVRLTADMQLKQVLQVKYLGEDKWRDASVMYFDPVADATIGDQLVHLKLPNPEGRRAGQQVIVKLPDNVAAAK